MTSRSGTPASRQILRGAAPDHEEPGAAGVRKERRDGPGEEGDVLLDGEAADASDDEGFGRDAQRRARRGAVPSPEPLDGDAGGNHMDRDLDTPLRQEIRNAPAGRDDAVAEIGVPGRQLDDEPLERGRVARDEVSVLLVERVMGEHERHVPERRNAQRRVAQEIRVVGVNDVGQELVQRGEQDPRDGKAHGKVAAAEFLDGRQTDHIRFRLRHLLEGGRDDHDAMAPPAVLGGEGFHRARDAADVGREGIRHHQDVHARQPQDAVRTALPGLPEKNLQPPMYSPIFSRTSCGKGLGIPFL
jgi:hypothetical protein